MPGSVFEEKGKEYVRMLVEPLLAHGLCGEIKTYIADGCLEFCVPVTSEDKDNLVDSCCLAYDTLLQKLASADPGALPPGVLIDRIGIRLESAGY